MAVSHTVGTDAMSYQPAGESRVNRVFQIVRVLDQQLYRDCT